MYSRVIIFISIVVFSIIKVSAQGLEKIIVEKYYISDENDTAANWLCGVLPPGSVTYRIYADLLPGYKFQAVYGVPGHELKIATTTFFFNNKDKGSYIPTVIPFRNIGDNTIMLDSWLSAGAACENNWGILKSEDDDKNTIINKTGLLQSESKKAGIPIKKRDGLYSGEVPRLIFFGIDSMAMSMFGRDNSSSRIFATENGSWATLEGTTGPTPENKVLIAQMTTDGDFSFELNIQIGKPGEGYERYVARNPVADEKVEQSLIYRSK